MSDNTLPSIADIRSADGDAPLASVLSTLFEPSDVLLTHLVPQLKERLAAADNQHLTSYSQLVDIALSIIEGWDESLRAEFISGHPRIGEVNNLSKLSAQEQAAKATPPEVLARLAHLNACYEYQYPGLVYITFVNGRTRTAIMREMEDALGLPQSLDASQPPIGSLLTIPKGDPRWKQELERAVQDVGKIAKSRIIGLGLA